MKNLSILCCLLICFSCGDTKNQQSTKAKTSTTSTTTPQYKAPQFTLAEANALLELPLHCVETEYPNKLGQTIGGPNDLKEPSELHPIFYGCFDWHSAVHGYWSMVTLVAQFPDLTKAEETINILEKNITEANVTQEVTYFNKPINTAYERTYGWAWLLKLSEALHTWDHPKAPVLAATLQPLADKIVENYTNFLPKLVYPIRVGEHPNTAFGLSFAYDYAVTVENESFQQLLAQRAKDFYLNDTACPLSWEPSGYDFLSPCLEEVAMMRRILTEDEFMAWIDTFMPQLKEETFDMAVGEVGDRTDGKLVHLDGVNFSRAWVLYGLADQYEAFSHLKNVAHKHIAYSYPNLVGDSYEGGHWLGSFAIYALLQNKE